MTLVADRIAAATGRHPLANPVLIAIAITGTILALRGTPYAMDFDGAQFVHVLLGPATVVLALPLHEHSRTVMRALVAMLAALIVGCGVALDSAIGLARRLGIPAGVVASLPPKSVTSGIAMGISEALGGDPTLTAILVMLMDLMRIRDMRARGFAVGLAAHGVGTARAFQVSEVAGTFAGIAMGLNAFLTDVLVPLALHIPP